MSTTSCPRCSAIVTLPVGVSNETTVRCPLCHAHYTLADALINMPPLLEVVDDADDPLAADWPAPGAAAGASGMAALALPEDDLLGDETLELTASDDDSPLETLELSDDWSDTPANTAAANVEGEKETEDETFFAEADATIDAFELTDEAAAEDVLAFGEVEDELPLVAEEAPDELSALELTEEAELPALDDLSIGGDLSAAEDTLELGELSSAELPAEDLPADVTLDFGGALLADDASELDDAQPVDAGAETLEFGSLEFNEESPGEVQFDLLGEAADLETPADEAQTIEFGEPLGNGPAGEEELKFDFDDAVGDDAVGDEAETVQFLAPLENLGSENQSHEDSETVEFNFEDAAPPAADLGELREFEDLRFEPTEAGEAIPVDVPVAPLVAPAAEATDEAAVLDKKGKKKAKKEKKVKVAAAEGKKPRSLVASLVSVLVPALIAVPLALYGALWISKDYDFLGLGGMLPTAMLPAEYSKKPIQVAQFTPPALPDTSGGAAAVPLGADDEPAHEAGAVEHVAERPVDESPEMPADEPPTLATPPADDMADDAHAGNATADDPFAPAPAETVAAPAEPAEDLFAPVEAEATMPGADQVADDRADDDLFGPAASPPVAAPADADDPFAPADSTPAEPADDVFAPAADDAAMPADDADDPFAPAPANDVVPAPTEPADDLFAPSADNVADDDPFAPAPPAAPPLPADDDPNEADPFAPAPPAEADDAGPMMPAADDPAEDPFAPAPAADAPEEDPFAPAPAGDPDDAPSDDDPFAPAPVAPAQDPFGLPDEPAIADEPAANEPITRPAAEDPFAPAPSLPAEEMPAEEMPAEEMPADGPAVEPADEADPFAPAPREPELPSVPAGPLERPAQEEVLTIPHAEPLPAPSDEASELGPRNLTPASPADVAGALQATFVAGQEMMAAEVSGDDAQLRKARAAFYVNLFGMADAVTAAQQGPGGELVDAQLASLGPTLRQQLASDPRRLEALKVFGARWIGFPRRTNNGVVVSGTVESAEQVGKLFHTKARLGHGAEAPLVTIVSTQQPEVAVGDTLLALGSIVDDPAAHLAGYEGNEPTVIWSGLSIKVPGAAN